MSSSSFTPAPARPASPAVAGPSPLHLEEIAAAKQRAKPLRKAVTVAVLDGWGLAIFGGITILTGLTSFPTLALGCGMCLAAQFEFRGATRLRRLDTRALHSLARNQLALGAALFAYALWCMLTPESLTQAVAATPELNSMMRPIEDLARVIHTIVYGVIMLVAVFAQGGTAMFYRRRERQLHEYLAQTPAWLVQAQRDGLEI
jgi:hypothetical protein